MIKIRDLLAYIVLRGLSLPFLALPYPIAQKLGITITRMLFPLFPRYRRIAIDNIAAAFPDHDEAWHLAVLKRHIDHLGRLLADICWKPRMDRRWFERYVRYEGASLEIQQEAMDSASHSGKGIILVTGHIGSWEDVPQYGGFVYGGAAVYKRVKNPFVDRWMLRWRGRTGTEMVPMENTHAVIHRLKAGQMILMASDQNAGRAGLLIDFLHRPASTYRGPAFLSAMTGAPLLFIAPLHGPDGRLHVHIENLGPVDPALYANTEEAVRAGTERWVQRLEAWVKRYPEQYFWVHRRWKTTPEMMERWQASRVKRPHH